jgi:hypothetical protein
MPNTNQNPLPVEFPENHTPEAQFPIINLLGDWVNSRNVALFRLCTKKSGSGTRNGSLVLGVFS